MMAQDGLERLCTFEAIYFGSVGDPKVPNHISLWGLRLPVCQGFDQYANSQARAYPAGNYKPTT
jgi:tartrate dehydrogenase/decarboxylase/D-malate dehydrogenase